MDKVKIGFIGCGRHATKDLYPQICHVTSMELVATCDLKEDLAKKNAGLFGAKSWYTHFERMLDNEDLDAVIIVGPPNMHMDVGLECLKRGFHIFVEKPSALTVKDAKNLAESAESSRKFGQVGHMMRHSPPLKLAKQIISSDEFGKPNYIESKYYTSGPREPRDFWGLRDLKWTYMLVQGLHPIDLAHFFMGAMKNITGRVAEGKEGRLAFAITVEFMNGAVGFLNLNSSFSGWETRLEIGGSEGRFISVENMSGLRYVEPNPWTERFSFREPILSKKWEISPYDQGERIGYRDELSHFIGCIISKSKPSPDLWDEYNAMVVAQAILKSIEDGITVSISY